VRRQEEIIWVRENGFGCLVSIISAPHNLHNYDELNVNYVHHPYSPDNVDDWARGLFKDLKGLLAKNTKVIVHGEEVGDRIMGAMGAFIRWSGLVEEPTEAIMVAEKLAGHQLDSAARSLILRAHELR
jgi:hypothetical protein